MYCQTEPTPSSLVCKGEPNRPLGPQATFSGPLPTRKQQQQIISNQSPSPARRGAGKEVYNLPGKPFTASRRLFRNTGFQLRSQRLMVQFLPDQHQLILGLAFPVFIIQRKSLAAQMEHMAFGALLKPEDAFGPKNRLW